MTRLTFLTLPRRTGLSTDTDFLSMLESIAHIPQATKSWKPYVQEAFSDSAIFDLRKGDTRTLWRKLFAVLLNSEKDKLLDLFGTSLT
jgi:hypothetical protein